MRNLFYIGQRRSSVLGTLRGRFFVDCYYSPVAGDKSWNIDEMEKLEDPNFKITADSYGRKSLRFVNSEWGYLNTSNGTYSIRKEGHNESSFGLSRERGIAVWDKSKKIILLVNDIEDAKDLDLEKLETAIEVTYGA